MRDGDLTIGLDLGTTGARAGVFSQSGEVRGTHSVSYPMSVPAPGWAEQDPGDWWKACTEAIRGAVGSSGAEAGSIAGIGVSGQMHGSVFLDSGGSPVRPCILWCDQRAARHCSVIEENVGSSNLRRWVGNPAVPGFTAPKVLWLRENEPDCYRRTSHLLLPKDYINFRLTGIRASEPSDASGTLLLDVGQRTWSTKMVEALEIPSSWLPPLVRSDGLLGGLCAQAAEETGLPRGVPVAGGGADNACGALGMGVLRPGRVAVSIGSSGTVLAPTRQPEADPDLALHLFCHVVPDTWYMMGVMLSAGLSLRWFRDELGEPERTVALENGCDPYRLLADTAAMAPAGCEGLVFLPYLTGERTPHADPYASGVFFGLDLTKTRAHLVRSVMEGVVFGLKDSLELIRSRGIPAQAVVTGGGGSRSLLWRRMQADTFGLPVAFAAESEAAMLGAALLGGVAGALYDSTDAACEAAVSFSETLDPDPGTAPAYAESYGIYVSLYPALRDLFHPRRAGDGQ